MPKGIGTRYRAKAGHAQLDVNVPHGGNRIQFTWRFHTLQQADACEKWVKDHISELQPIAKHRFLCGGEVRLDHTWPAKLTAAYKDAKVELPESLANPAPAAAAGLVSAPGASAAAPVAATAPGATLATAAAALAAAAAALAAAAAAAAPAPVPAATPAPAAAANRSQPRQHPPPAEMPAAKRQRLSTDMPVGLLQIPQHTPHSAPALPIGARPPAPTSQQAATTEGSMLAAPDVGIVGMVWMEDQLQQDGRRLGAGGYGTVYAARTPQHGLVAVKRLSVRYPLQQQQSILAHVQRVMDKGCPALVPYLGARAKANGEVVLFMERHPGITLADFHLKHMGAGPVLLSEFSTKGKVGFRSGTFRCKPGAVPWELKQQVAQKLVEALAQLQKWGLVHRDLKPQNIMLDVEEDAEAPGGYRVLGVQFVDLEAVAGAEENALTANLGPCNTMLYAAPEVTVESKLADVHTAPAAAAAGGGGAAEQQQYRQVPLQVYDEDAVQGLHLSSSSLAFPSDIYSMGMVLFEIFTDAEARQAEVKQAIVQKEETLNEFLVFADLPDEAQGLLRGCLALAPAARLTMQQLLPHSFFTAVPADLQWNHRVRNHPGEYEKDFMEELGF